MRKNIALLAMVFLLVSLVGCGNEMGDIGLKSGECGIYISSDGKANYAVKDDFSQEYLKKSELEEKANKEVENFNYIEGSVGEAMELKEVSVEDKQAYVQFSFVTLYDLTKYINTFENIDNDRFYIGGIADYKIKDDSLKLKSIDKKNEVSFKDLSKKSYYVFFTKKQTKFQVDGKIKYISENCKVNGKVITTEDEYDSYIIFEIDNK